MKIIDVSYSKNRAHGRRSELMYIYMYIYIYERLKAVIFQWDAILLPPTFRYLFENVYNCVRVCASLNQTDSYYIIHFFKHRKLNYSIQLSNKLKRIYERLKKKKE